MSDTSKQLNDVGLSTENPRHIHSSYKLPEKLSELIGQTKLWIMTEHDRSATTLLFPSDY
ncbi:hypothetical protein AB835_08170 [Candidatus Endobugula sertula]|uniref:Uncharacterized protein n=1 Tax=Candidatus Endobugula sertula TaxID=62101 RepID=A0A1D2QPQ8_9GAMM|nr:hypothetical protein AB835_08170 [Candidatus Endobugula sertula]